MSTLKAIKQHAISVSNIQKITNTIKMVAMSKFMGAEKVLRKVRVFGTGTRIFYKASGLTYDAREGVRAVVTSDRGLCGGLHTRVCKKVRLDQTAEPSQGGLVCLGEKAKNLLSLQFKKQFRLVVNGVGHSKPTFKQASSITTRLLGDWPMATLTFPFFHNIVSFDVLTIPMVTPALVSKSHVPNVYEMDDDDLDFYLQFSSVSLVFYAMNEAFVSELANRITAMTGASRNAGKVKKQLMLEYNRKRQEKITKEIIDIISGLQATQKEKKKKEVRLKYLMDEVEASGSSGESGEVPDFVFDLGGGELSADEHVCLERGQEEGEGTCTEVVDSSTQPQPHVEDEADTKCVPNKIQDDLDSDI